MHKKSTEVHKKMYIRKREEVTRVYADDPMKTENRITTERMTLVDSFSCFPIHYP